MRYVNIRIGLLVEVLMVGIFGGEVVAKVTSLPQRHIVHIQGFAFRPPHLTVAPGDTVVWVNGDFVPHFVSIADGRWQSPVLVEGQFWELVVDEAGKFQYLWCFTPR